MNDKVQLAISYHPSINRKQKKQLRERVLDWVADELKNSPDQAAGGFLQGDDYYIGYMVQPNVIQVVVVPFEFAPWANH